MIFNPNEITQGILVLADISGYTQFSRLHFTSLLHAEQIINELMESILQSSEFPLQVGQLEGDAVLFFIETAQGYRADAAREAARQVQKFFMAFNLRERSLISCDAGCACQACNQIGELKLKAVLHFGSFSRRELRGVMELTGSDVALMHALLKAPMQEREHILLTQEFYQLSGGLEGQQQRETRQFPFEDEKISVHVYFPHIDLSAVPSPKGAGPVFSARLNQYSFGRMLVRKPRAVFNNLPDVGLNLVLYLLEGLQSALNIIRKTVQRALRRSSMEVVVKPAMLLMMEVNSNTERGRALAFELLDATISAARPPLILNKLEGNASLLYALAENERGFLLTGLVNQAERMFHAFEEQRNLILKAKPEMMQELNSIRFRAIFHAGDVAFKRMREFDELGGVAVILIHRLLQSQALAASTLWMTDSVHQLTVHDTKSPPSSMIVDVEGLGQETVWLRSL